MKAKDFDKAFEAGEDMMPYVDLSRAERINAKPKRVNVDFPEWMVNGLDREAKRLGVTRQSVIKMWIAEDLRERAVG